MKRLLLVLTCIILISCVSATNFTFEYPKTIYSEKSFEVTIDMETDETWDIKIWVNQPIKEYSMIYDINKESWKSSRNFVIQIFPQQKTFLVKSLNFIGETEICVKLRPDPDSTPLTEKCKDIIVEESIDEDEEPEDEEEEETSEEENYEEEEEEEEDAKEIIKVAGNAAENPECRCEEEIKTIVLNPQNIKTETDSGEVSKNNAVYSFMAFSVLLALLFLIKKKKYKNEFT